MAFICKYQLNNGAINESDEVTFIRFIKESFGSYHKEPVKLADVLFNGFEASIWSNSAGVPSTQGDLRSGDKITSETEIAYFAADGEDIPYNRPYATIEIV